MSYQNYQKTQPTDYSAIAFSFFVNVNTHLYIAQINKPAQIKTPVTSKSIRQ